MTDTTSSRRGRGRTLALALAAFIGALGVSLVAVDVAEARRGGGFGSRGARTFQAPPPTRTAPQRPRPVERSTTERPAAAGAQRPGATAQTSGASRTGGMLGGLAGGLMLGGLIGLMFGGGIGGLAGVLGLFLQIAVIGLVIYLVVRLFSGSRQSGPALAGASAGRVSPMNPHGAQEAVQTGGTNPYAGSVPPVTNRPVSLDELRDPVDGEGDEIGITGADLDTFERLLTEVQAAYTREDRAALSERCTDEMLGYLTEELDETMADGLRNEVRDVQLLQGDLAEAWREGAVEYATVAMRYESVDVLVDRNTGAMEDGDTEPSETTELWTFTRRTGDGTHWRLTAINDA